MAENNIKSKRLSRILIVISVIIVSWLIFEAILRGFNVVRSEYGIDPILFIKVVIGSEIFFDLGIVLIILGSGAIKLKLKNILSLDFSNIIFENKLVYIGFTFNRIAAVIPPLYLIIAGWSRMPIAITAVIIVDVIITCMVTIIPFEGRGTLTYRKEKKF